MNIEITPQPKQYLAYEAWQNDAVDDVIYGGYAGGGKTWWGCEAIMIDCLRWPGTKYFIGRKELKTLMQTSYATLTQKVFPKYNLQNGKHWEFNAQRHEMKIRAAKDKEPSQINFLHLGEIPSDPLFDRFGSHEYTRGFIEEASEVPFKAYDVLKSRIGRWRNKEANVKSKLALTLNPSQDWPYRIFYDPWKKAGRPVDPNTPLVSIRGMDANGNPVDRTFVFIPATPGDNTFTAAEYYRNLATITDPVIKARLMDGDWEFTDAVDILFSADAIADMFTTRLPANQEQYLTVDVARFGGDRIVITYWRGWQAWKIDLYARLPIHETADHVRTAFTTYGIPREHVLIDSDGIGGGVVDLLPGCIPFAGASAPFGRVGEIEIRERYENLRTQCAYYAAEKAQNRQIAISAMDAEARELAAADLQQFKRRDAEKDGKLKIAKKEDMKQALGRSPDVGDTIVMRSYFDLRVREQAISRSAPGGMSVYIPDFE